MPYDIGGFQTGTSCHRSAAFLVRDFSAIFLSAVGITVSVFTAVTALLPCAEVSFIRAEKAAMS
jgi:hypothetical protein